MSASPPSSTPSKETNKSEESLKKSHIKVLSSTESSLVEDKPELYDPKKPLKFPRYPVRFDYVPFDKLNEDTQREVQKQLRELKKIKNLGVFVPNVDEYTNPFVIHVFLLFPFNFSKNFIKTYSFFITIAGPHGSVYAGKYFDLQIVFDDSFPQHPPTVMFTPQGQTGDMPRCRVCYYM